MKPTISFETTSDSFGPAREFLCSVWPLTKNGEQLVIGNPLFSNRMVLIGSHRYGSEVSVLELPEAGAYLIDLGYPNGTSLRRTVSLTEGERYRFIVQNQKSDSRLPPEIAPSYSPIPRVALAAFNIGDFKGPDLEVRSVTQPNSVSLKQLRDFASDLNEQSINVEVLQRIQNASLTCEVQLPSVVVSSFRANSYQRRWLVVSGKGKPQTMVAYPLGWTNQGGDVFTLSLHRKGKTGGDTAKWSVGLKLTDPVYGSLVEHLTRRDVSSSSSITESMRGQATTGLYEKEDNPFAAAAAAYLFALGRTELEHRREWMVNLNHRFNWLPDGPIALGWKLLREGRRGSSAWHEAREMFVLAHSRGLPYYTVGLHIFVEALTILSMADKEDQTVQEMLAAARAADVACVRTEPFTTLQVSKFLGLPIH
jgi:hypothetical protein